MGARIRAWAGLGLLAAVAAGLYWAGSGRREAELAREEPVEQEAGAPSAGGEKPLMRVEEAAVSMVPIDPEHLAKAERLHSPELPPEQDLVIVAEFIETYRKARGGNPTGDNADITAALTGTQGHRGRVFPDGHRAVREGELVDRWGTPYWFHPNSGHEMEVRSAGPDRQLFTPDDGVLNPSPGGLGVTPAGDAGAGSR